MAINPRYAERLARDLLELYTEAETRMLEIVANELADDIYAPEWAAIKQAEISKVKSKLEKLVQNLDKKMPETAAETVKKAYTTGQKGIEADLKKIKPDIKTGFGMIDERKVMVLTRQLAGTLGETHLRITRQSLDEYRSIIGKVSQMVELGVETRQQATQRALNEFADKGITGFIDKAGRSWSLRSYAEMATRSTTGQAAIEGAIQRLRDNDYDLVIVSFHADSCPLCEPWEGQVLSISGKNENYPSLDAAIADGLFHPNCYSEDTEVYTDEGWKFFHELNGHEKIFALNPDTHIPEWVKYNKIISYPVNGEMVSFKSNSFDLLVTKNHMMYVGLNSHSSGGKKTVNWKLIPAADCLGKNFKQLRCVNWKGELTEEFMGIPIEDFAMLLGYYLSEGHTERNKKGEPFRVTITQKPGSASSDKMLKDLSKLGFRRCGKRIYKDNKELSLYLSKLGKSHEKYIPEWFMNQPPYVLEKFLDAFRLGDGSERTRLYKNSYVITKEYFTSSKKMAGQIGELIVKTGHYPSFGIMAKAGEIVKHHNGEYTTNHDVFVIRQNNIKASYHNVSPSIAHQGIQSEIINYSGMVWDVELEKYHILFVRRNGKTAWSGNCGHSLGAYIPGLTEKPTQAEMGKGDFEEAQEQRRLEREIRRWKQRQAVAITDEEKKKAASKVREKQAKLREFLDDTGRKRQRDRESV